MASRDPGQKPVTFRRDKTDPCADFWHTLKVGAPLAVVMILILPPLFRLFSQ